MVEIITIKERGKVRFDATIAKLQKDNPQVKALHRFRLKTQIFTKEDVGKVMELCLNLNQE